MFALAALVLSLSAPTVSVGRTIEPPPAPGAAASPSHAAHPGVQLALLGDRSGDAALGTHDAEADGTEEQGTAGADDDSNGSESAVDAIGGGMAASADADDDESESESEDDNNIADADGEDDDREMVGSDSDEDVAGADDESDDEIASFGDSDEGGNEDGTSGSDSDEDFDGDDGDDGTSGSDSDEDFDGGDDE